MNRQNASTRPERRHVYQNHHLDSTRWDYFTHRPGDIVISTSYKAGTTLVQTIVGNLLYPNADAPMPMARLSPWLDKRFFPLELVLNQLEAETSRRFIKTHLPLDGLPYYDDVQYLVVGRDPRDVFMSLLNHWEAYTDEAYRLLNGTPGRVGDAFPRFVDDTSRCWRDWMTHGWFAWESDGYPYWSHLHHCRTWWEFRHLPNILFVHYGDLRADLDGAMRRIADYLRITVPAARWPHVVDACTFETVKRNPEKVVGELDHMFAGGAQTFIHKGTNGRWRDVLTDTDLALYAQAMQRTLSGDCARWLEHGGPLPVERNP
jgi:aryl sulfotransferase